MTYTVDKNPPPLDLEYAGRGPRKSELRLVLESMKPGDGLHVPDYSSTRVTAMVAPVKRATGYGFVTRKDDFVGCYVWCLDPTKT